MSDEYEKSDFASVYFNTKENVCLVVAMARRGRAQGEVGEPIAVNEAEFESRVAAVLLGVLDAYRTKVWSQDIARRSASNAEYRAFTKKHVSVSVKRLDSGDLVIAPLHHESGGYTGNQSEQIVIPKADVPQQIPAALRTAFRTAT